MANKSKSTPNELSTPKRNAGGRNSPVIGDNGMLTEPGDNSRYIRHALATYKLPPIDISDPVQVEERIDWYFMHCFENDMKPTVKGLCNSLGIHKDTLRTWANGEVRASTHTDLIKKAYDFLEELWESYMLNGKINPVSGIFLAKNQWGYRDQQEMVLTPNNRLSDSDYETVANKYKQLPSDYDSE